MLDTGRGGSMEIAPQNFAGTHPSGVKWVIAWFRSLSQVP